MEERLRKRAFPQVSETLRDAAGNTLSMSQRA